MLPIQQDSAGCRRRDVRTDLDLILERAGSAWERTAEEREAFALVARVLGCDIAADHVEGAHRRRAQVRAAPDPAPRPGPKPKLTPPRPPILRVLDGDREVAVDPDRAWWDDVRRVCERHDGSHLSPLSGFVLDEFRSAAAVNLR